MTSTNGTTTTADTTTRVAFTHFVERLIARPDRADIVAALARGHEHDRDGWCRHPVHEIAGEPEQHPCSTSRLVERIRAALRDSTGPHPPDR